MQIKPSSKYKTQVNKPIITNILDGLDWYKITMGSLIFHEFSHVATTYQFTNRDKTPFPPGFDYELKQQIEMLSDLVLGPNEFDWLNHVSNYLRPTYLEWFCGFRYEAKAVQVVQVGGDLRVTIRGPWYKRTFWETTLMAIISELYFELIKVRPAKDWKDRIRRKAELLEEHGCHWIDFSTRRRFHRRVQEMVVKTMRQCKGFLGTSNPYLAYKYHVTPQGTYAHEGPMAMGAIYGPRRANPIWTGHWSKHFDGNLGIALTDTYTTDVFLRDFGCAAARQFDGGRQDSNDPYAWGHKMVNHYRSLRIQPESKRLVFSDALKVGPANERMVGKAYNYIPLDLHFRSIGQPIGGIGTFFSNDVLSITDVNRGIKPLNIVIKLTEVDAGQGPIEAVKLSDSPGKHHGSERAVRITKEELGID